MIACSDRQVRRGVADPWSTDLQHLGRQNLVEPLQQAADALGLGERKGIEDGLANADSGGPLLTARELSALMRTLRADLLIPKVDICRAQAVG